MRYTGTFGWFNAAFSAPSAFPNEPRWLNLRDARLGKKREPCYLVAGTV